MYRTHSVGIEVGKQISLNEKWIFELSLGPYYFLSDDNFSNSRDQSILFLFGSPERWSVRFDLKFEIKL